MLWTQKRTDYFNQTSYKDQRLKASLSLPSLYLAQMQMPLINKIDVEYCWQVSLEKFPGLSFLSSGGELRRVRVIKIINGNFLMCYVGIT